MKNQLIVILISVVALNAQNLVLNNSFECYSNCPVNFGEVENAFHWSAPTTGTTDFFSCNAFYLGTPQNFFGNQEPQDGEAYAGFYAFGGGDSCNYREYVQGKLMIPLVAGECYSVSFYVSLADKSSYATQELGMYFSDTMVKVNHSCALPFAPQVKSPSNDWLDETDGWTEISGTFTATGAEKYFIIGNFSSIDNGLDMSPPALLGDELACYFLDDICVAQCNQSCQGPFVYQDTLGVCEEDNIDSVELRASQSGKQYLWSTSDRDTFPSIKVVAESASYQVEVYDDSTCASVFEEFVVDVGPCQQEEEEEKEDTLTLPFIWIPNAISPNGDGVNDVFRIAASGVRSSYLTIYNQWGGVIFKSNDVHEPWGSQSIPPKGVYAYTLSVVFENGKVQTQQGNITVI